MRLPQPRKSTGGSIFAFLLRPYLPLVPGDIAKSHLAALRGVANRFKDGAY
jgi:hypothetical protein